MVKDEKNKCLNLLNKKLNFSHQNKKFILPNKDFKKVSLESNKVCKSGVFWDYI
jgi:hypothetical protein